MREFKEGDICYFAGFFYPTCGIPIGWRRTVRWGVIQSMYKGGAFVDYYGIKNRNTINGKSIFEFKPEIEWHELPRRWTYDYPLFEEGYDALPEEFHRLRIDSPEDLQYGIEKGWLIKEKDNIHRPVEAEIIKNMWRLRWRSYSPGNEPKIEVGDFLMLDELCHTYEEAKAKVQELIEEDIRENSLNDDEWSIEQIDRTLAKWARACEIDEESDRYKKAREFLVAQPDVFNIVSRFCDGKLQWKYDRQKKWKLVEEE